MSSTGMRPALPPASMAMFEMERRSSIGILSMALPVNSMALYRAPSTPIMPMMCRMTSLPVTPGASSPLMTNLMVSGTLNQALPVAMPTPASVEPTPVENAPSAP